MSPYRFYGRQRFLTPDGTVLQCNVPMSKIITIIQKGRKKTYPLSMLKDIFNHIDDDNEE